MTGRRFVPLASEIALALGVIASFLWTVSIFRDTAFLPQPFVFDTNDTFMDWFNTAYWANNQGAFDVWKTIYPPLSFAFLDTFSLPGCYLQSPFHARDCDWLGRATIYGFYVADVVLAWIAFRRADRSTAPMRTVAIAIGLPLLFTLERGNLILVAFAFFIIAHGEIASRRWQVAAMAMTINFKPYLVLPAFAHAMKRDWRIFELAGIAAIALYLLTLAWVGGGSPLEIVENTRNWVIFQGGKVYDEINYSTSYAPLLNFQTMQVPVLQFVPSRLVERIVLLVPVVIHSSQAIAFAALVAAWVQPRAIPTARMATLLFGVYIVTQSPGGYAQLFLLFLVFLEPWRRAGPILAVTCAYLLSLVGDVQITSVLQINATSWLGGRSVEPDFGLTWGHFIRPGLIVLILWALSIDTVIQSLKAHRAQRPSLGLMPA